MGDGLEIPMRGSSNEPCSSPVVFLMLVEGYSSWAMPIARITTRETTSLREEVGAQELSRLHVKFPTDVLNPSFQPLFKAPLFDIHTVESREFHRSQNVLRSVFVSIDAGMKEGRIMAAMQLCLRVTP